MLDAAAVWEAHRVKELLDAAFLTRVNNLSQITDERDTAQRKDWLRTFPGIEQSLLSGRDVD